MKASDPNDRPVHHNDMCLDTVKSILQKEQLGISLGRFYPSSSWLMLRNMELI